MARVFISGGTGFLGVPLTVRLVEDGHEVRCLARTPSQSRIPSGAAAVAGNPLDASTFLPEVASCDTYIHLTGVARASPLKAPEFERIDYGSFEASRSAALASGVKHFIYLSVAHPAPIMRSYIAIRRRCEARLALSDLNVTILRPWYVVGPGRSWPLALQPLYSLAEAMPCWRATSRRLGLVTLSEMIEAIACSVAQPPTGIQTWDVQEIRSNRRSNQHFRSSPGVAVPVADLPEHPLQADSPT